MPKLAASGAHAMQRNIALFQQYRYVIANTLVSLIAFARNLLFMRTLEIGELGQIALMQTIVLLVGFVQFGTINGAYILFAEHNVEQRERIVNAMSFGLLGLFALAGAAAALGAGGVMAPTVGEQTMLIGILCGLFTLASTWMNNVLIAYASLAKSNSINLAAVLLSLVAALLSIQYGLTAALLSILIQPMFAAAATLIAEKSLRPTSLKPDIDIFRTIISAGIRPFYGALFVLATYQIERWFIVLKLGEQALGQFYIVMMYMSFFTLIPASLLNVHFPRAIRAYQQNEHGQFCRILRRHGIEIGTYGLAALLATVTLLPIAVSAFIPKFSASTHLVFWVFPALFIFVMRDSAALVLYSAKRTGPIMVSGVILLATYAALLAGAAALDQFTLTSVVVLRGIAVFVSTAYLFELRRVVLRSIS